MYSTNIAKLVVIFKRIYPFYRYYFVSQIQRYGCFFIIKRQSINNHTIAVRLNLKQRPIRKCYFAVTHNIIPKVIGKTKKIFFII